jgi:3-hydroxyisobutyrate dehydrogenase-like beta-hydroxyacid dehydrogenase
MGEIGFVGLGEMGLPMARNLLSKGCKTRIFDIRREPVNELTALGATGSATIKEIGTICEIIVIMARTTEQVEGIVQGKEGLLETCGKGACIIIMSTIDPLAVRRMAAKAKEKSIEIIDAPVSGGRQGAEAASLSIMVGGDEKTFQKVLPILEKLGKKISYLGSYGMGEVAKITNNLLLLIHMNAAYEAISLAAKAGLTTESLLKAVGPSTGNSWVLDHWDMVTSWKLNYKPEGTLDLIYKDFLLAFKLAQDLQIPLHLGAEASQLGRY